MTDDLHRWRTLALVAATLVVVSCPLHLAREALRRPAPVRPLEAEVRFVGRERCTKCHEKETKAWAASHHSLAMAEPTAEKVRGDFGDGSSSVSFEGDGLRARFFRRGGKYLVETEGPDGKPHDYEIAYTFGWTPLQQYLVRFPGGRLQALPVAWDTERKRWFFLYPGRRIPSGDWLHWTRNGQNWNGMCAQCHSTNLAKGYDAATDGYRTTWSEIEVSCEACHGPGFAARRLGGDPGDGAAQDPERRPRPEGERSRRTASWSSSAPPATRGAAELGGWAHGGEPLLNSHLPALLEEGLYYPDGQILDEDYEYGSFVQSKMYRMGVGCSDCHDPHSGRRLREGNALCTRCHAAGTYDDAAHHFHKKVWQGKPSDGVLCVKCHMPTRLYMVVDARLDHSIRVPRPDLTRTIGVPNACGQAGCHADKPLDWVASKYDAWYGRARKPHYGTVLAAARRRDPAAREGLLALAADPLSPPLVRATALSRLREWPGPRATPPSGVPSSTRSRSSGGPPSRRSRSPTRRNGSRASRRSSSDPLRAVRLVAVAELAGTPPGLLKPYQREALEKGTAEYVKTMEYSLDFAGSPHNIGNLWSKLGAPAKAEDYYRRSLAVDDLFFPAKANLALLLNGQGRSAEAEKLFREILAAYPENAEAAYSLGLLLAERGNLPEAAGFLAKAAEGMPRDPRVHYNAGLALARAGRDAEAERMLRRAVELRPVEPGAALRIRPVLPRTGALRRRRGTGGPDPRPAPRRPGRAGAEGAGDGEDATGAVATTPRCEKKRATDREVDGPSGSARGSDA